jgi:threonine dehydratase
MPGRDFPRRQHIPVGSYRPVSHEKVCVVLCGANTGPTDLAGQHTGH